VLAVETCRVSCPRRSRRCGAQKPSNLLQTSPIQILKKVAREEAIGGAKAQLLADDVEDRLAALEKEDRIEQLLTELKTKRGA